MLVIYNNNAGVLKIPYNGKTVIAVLKDRYDLPHGDELLGIIPSYNSNIAITNSILIPVAGLADEPIIISRDTGNPFIIPLEGGGPQALFVVYDEPLKLFGEQLTVSNSLMISFREGLPIFTEIRSTDWMDYRNLTIGLRDVHNVCCIGP